MSPVAAAVAQADVYYDNTHLKGRQRWHYLNVKLVLGCRHYQRRTTAVAELIAQITAADVDAAVVDADAAAAAGIDAAAVAGVVAAAVAIVTWFQCLKR